MDSTIGTGPSHERVRRRALADHRARLGVEHGVQRCRIWFAAVGFGQSFLYPGDRPWLSTVLAVALTLVWLAVRGALRRDPGPDGLRRIGLAAITADGIVIGVAMANLLRDPNDPVQMLSVVLAGEAAVRWGRAGGLAGGIVAGAMTAAWAIATHAQAGIGLPLAFVSSRFATMVGLGVLLGVAAGAARRERRLAEIVTDASTDLIATFGFDGKVRSINPACEAILGYRPDQVIGRDAADLIVEEDRPVRPPDVEEIQREGSRRVEMRFVHRDGRHIWLEVDLQADVEERVVCAVGRDVSERRRAEEELRRRAEHDELTGVANRAHLVSRLTQDLADRQRVHLLFVDLDGFKAVNDHHGHRVGDAVLREVAHRIRGAGGTSDLVARLAGDEFCVLLGPASSDAAARIRTTDIQDALAEPYERVGDGTPLAASVGWAASLPDDRPADLLERADLAMYAVKRRRRADATTRTPAPV